MPSLGDLVSRWALGRNPLLRGEIDELRLKMNRIEAATARLDTLSAPSMGLDPNVFCNSGRFSVLPADCAVLHKGADLSLANATWTTPGSWLGLSDPAVATHGMRIDAENGYVYVTGLPGDTVVGFAAWAQFASNATGVRSIRWNEAGTSNQVGSTVDGSAFVAGVLNTVHLFHVRVLKQADSYYFIDVFQNSGGALDLQEVHFAAWRIY